MTKEREQRIEKRLDAIIELLVLLVNQTEAQTVHPLDIRNNLMLDNADFQDYGKVFRPHAEQLTAVAAVEAVRQEQRESEVINDFKNLPGTDIPDKDGGAYPFSVQT